MIRTSLRIALVGWSIALTLGACSGAVKPDDTTDEVSASELIEGEWMVTKYQLTYDAAPDNPIDVTDSSDISYSFENGSYGYVCFPACLGITKAGSGTYTVDERRGTIRFTETHAELVPEFAHLARQLPAESRATYRFSSRNRLRLDQRIETISDGMFVQADVVIEAERD